MTLTTTAIALLSFLAGVIVTATAIVFGFALAVAAARDTKPVAEPRLHRETPVYRLADRRRDTNPSPPTVGRGA